MRRILVLTISIALILGTSSAVATSPKLSTGANTQFISMSNTTKKSVAKRSSTYRPYSLGVSPSPAPKWSPKGFRAKDGIYARFPNSTELLGVLSASATLAKAFKACSKNACGVVQVASYSGCTWWEVTSIVSGPISTGGTAGIIYGSLRTTAATSKPEQVVTILLISSQILKKNINVRNINITCHHSPLMEKVPTNKYVPQITTPTPTPTPTPTTSATESPTPSDSSTPTN
jgi:hypothetical protein